MISQEQKSNLAKLLATENLNVEHRKVKTAHFVPKTRTLCLPIWEDMSNDLYDLLCGHEVGHALYTPVDEKVTKVPGVPHSYVNVVEDIRIDKKMKIKYPGLRKSYYNGYKELVEKDFFGDISKDANHMKFIDRLNIFSKSGAAELDIEFNDTEKKFIEKSNNLETFDDVAKLAKEIFKYSKEENYDEEKDPLAKQLKIKQEEENAEGDEEITIKSTSGDDTGEDQNVSSGNSSNEEEEKEEGSKETSGDKPNNENKEKDENLEGKSSGQQGGHNPFFKGMPNPDNALTDVVYQSKIQKLAKLNEGTRDNKYVTLPSVKEENIVISYKKVMKLHKDYYATSLTLKEKPELLTESAERFKKWKKSQQSTISYMLKEFEMKKAADNYKKTLSSKSGALNMNKLHSFKFNDDIFRKLQVEPGDKNHGMMMFIDWSGSMSNNIYDTVCQTINLAMFCKSAQIPFRVYSFSDMHPESFNDMIDRGWSSRRAQDISDRPTPFDHTKANQLFVDNVSLIEWLSSEQRAADYNECMTLLFRFAEYHREYYSSNRMFYDTMLEPVSFPDCFRLGGTPLDQTVIASITLVKQFMNRYKVQKMNTIFLSDGCGHSCYNTTSLDKDGNVTISPDNDCQIVINDNETKKSIEYGYRFSQTTKPLYDLLRAKTGTSIIGFFINGRNTLRYYDISNFLPETSGYDVIDNIKKEIRINKVGTIKNHGYDELFIIPKKNLQIQDSEANINPDMSVARMKAEFSKTLKTKKISRVLLNKFVERVA